MEIRPDDLDCWRDFFCTANSDIFEVINRAILVAASDWPEQFLQQRERITETVYTCLLKNFSNYDRFNLSTLHRGSKEEEFNDTSGLVKEGEIGKVTNSPKDEGEKNSQNLASNYNYHEAEALTEEIENENQLVVEVLGIKKVLENKSKSEGELFESLRRLQLLDISVEILQVTKIGKVVNGLKKCGSTQISRLAKTLIKGWKTMVDEWIIASAALTRDTPESVNLSLVDQEGLPSPPLDDGALCVAQTSPVEFSQFFAGTDEERNLQDNEESKNKHENERKSASEISNRKRKLQIFDESHLPQKNDKLMGKPEADSKQKKSSSNSISKKNLLNDDRITMNDLESKQEIIRKPFNNISNVTNVGKENRSSIIKQDVTKEIGALESNLRSGHKPQSETQPLSIDKKPPTVLEDISTDDLVSKLEATRRNLKERYKQVENAKKQRTIQVMELHDLHKQELSFVNSHFKPVLQRRHAINEHR